MDAARPFKTTLSPTPPPSRGRGLAHVPDDPADQLTIAWGLNSRAAKSLASSLPNSRMVSSSSS